MESSDDDDQSVVSVNDNTMFNAAFNCAICKKQFKLKAKLSKHLQDEHGSAEPNRPQPCPICDRRFIHMDSLNAHIKHHYVHNMFNCTNCGELFDSPSALRRHRAKHTGKQSKNYLLRYQCERCSRSFSYKEDLNRHRKTHAGLPVVYECSPCGEKFPTRPDLIAHQFNRFGEPSHDCTVCSKTILHCECIDNEKRVRCDLCEKTFKNKTAMCAHKRTHDIARMFNCVYCNSEFVQCQALRDHKCPKANASIEDPLTIDASILPESNDVINVDSAFDDKVGESSTTTTETIIYKCSYCNEAFVRVDLLEAHFQSVHGSDTLYKCDRCHLEFGSIYNFKLHQCGNVLDEATAMHCDANINTNVTYANSDAW